LTNTIIYYFSGTGNSLYVARELKYRLPSTEIVPILSVLKEGFTVCEAEQVGLVFPIYVSTIPKPVRAFIERINLSSIQYLFAVTTNGGYPGRVDYLVYKLLKEKDIELGYYASLKMIVNTATGLLPAIMANKKWVDLISVDKIAKLELELPKEIDLIAEGIVKRVNNIGPDCHPNLVRKAIIAITGKMSPIEKAKAISFFVDQNCNGCCTCEKVCPSEKIILANGKPEWLEQKQCYFCYACFNFCPQQAILVKGYKYKTGRYKHPQVNAEDIARQKDPAAV